MATIQITSLYFASKAHVMHLRMLCSVALSLSVIFVLHSLYFLLWVLLFDLQHLPGIPPLPHAQSHYLIRQMCSALCSSVFSFWLCTFLYAFFSRSVFPHPEYSSVTAKIAGTNKLDKHTEYSRNIHLKGQTHLTACFYFMVHYNSSFFPCWPRTRASVTTGQGRCFFDTKCWRQPASKLVHKVS